MDLSAERATLRTGGFHAPPPLGAGANGPVGLNFSARWMSAHRARPVTAGRALFFAWREAIFTDLHGDVGLRRDGRR